LGKRPIPEHGLAINVLFRNQAPRTAVIRLIPVIAHDEVVMLLDECIRVSPRESSVIGGQVRLFNQLIIYEELTLVVDPDGLARQTNDPLNEGLGRIIRKPEDYNVVALNRVKTIDELVNEYPLIVLEPRQHRSTFDLDWLHDEDDDQDGGNRGKDYVAGKGLGFGPQRSLTCGFFRIDNFDVLIVFGTNSRVIPDYLLSFHCTRLRRRCHAAANYSQIFSLLGRGTGVKSHDLGR